MHRFAIFTYVHGSRHPVALYRPFESASQRIASNGQSARHCDLVGVDSTANGRVVDLAVMFTRKLVAVLFQHKLLFADAAQIVHRHRPVTGY